MSTKEIRERHSAATPGLWEIEREEDPYADDFEGEAPLMFPETVGPLRIEHEGSVAQVEADAAFVSNAHNDVGALLGMNDTLGAALVNKGIETGVEIIELRAQLKEEVARPGSWYELEIERLKARIERMDDWRGRAELAEAELAKSVERLSEARPYVYNYACVDGPLKKQDRDMEMADARAALDFIDGKKGEPKC